MEWYLKFGFFGLLIVISTLYTMNYYFDYMIKSKDLVLSGVYNYKTPPLPNLAIMFFFTGVSGYITTKYFYEKFKDKKTIKAKRK